MMTKERDKAEGKELISTYWDYLSRFKKEKEVKKVVGGSNVKNNGVKVV
jgi:hypothetical protein